MLDPFMGSGTTAVVAESLGRDWLGIELNPQFAVAATGSHLPGRTTELIQRITERAAA